jgi:hypothetical protein
MAPGKLSATRRRGLWIGVVGGLLAVAALVAVVIATGFGDDTPGPTPSATAALGTCGPLVGAGALCSDTPECFDAKPAPVDCAGRHTWEVFAYGALPAGSQISDKGDQTVSAVCSRPTLISVSMSASTWRIEVLLPSLAEQKAGPTTFRCLAGKGDGALTGEQLHKAR